MTMIELVARALTAQMNSGYAAPNELARAAIAAMREPTDAMVTAGTNSALKYEPDEQQGYTCILWEWQAMIDAALEEK